jgi:hypothetical protein
MANVLYPKFKQALFNKEINLDTDTIKVMLLDADYTYNAAHDFLDDVAAGSRVDTPITLANTSITDGVFDADDVTFTTVSNATDVVAILIYKDTGVEATSNLIAYIDVATGLT